MTHTEERPLARADDHYRRMLDVQHEMICEWLLDGTVVFGNRVYREHFGFGEDVVGRSLADIVEWNDGEDFQQLIDDLLTAGDTRVLVRHYADGRVVEWTDTVLDDARGMVSSIMSVGRDITERVSAEKALERTTLRHRTLVTHILDSILLLDRDGAVIDTTSALREDLGYAPATGTLVEPFPLLHPDDVEMVNTEFRSLVERGHGATAWLETRVRRADGEYSVVEVSGTNLLEDPVVEAVVITARNVDVRKRIERELAERQAQSEAAMRQRIAFVEQVSHELRNPLHGMLGLSELLTKSELSEPQADAAWAIYRQSTTMRRIVDDLLDVAQIEVGHLRVRPERLDVQYAFNDCTYLAREAAPAGVHVVADPPADDVRHAMGDPDRVRQALTNLLSNACKYTRQGEVRVRACPGDAPSTVRVSVLDQGPGIDPHDVDRLFQPYERGSKAGVPGVGLGLAIVKGTIEAMGGTVGARQRPNGGSEFWFELPLADADPTPGSMSAAPASTVETTVFPLRALVVDDDPVNLMLARMQLQKLGPEVVTAPDGESAWALLQEQEFDVALIDVQMPGMSGLELVRLARGLDRPLPVMAVMTASATAADRQAALDAGADMFVPKPATVQEVREVLVRRMEWVG